MKIQLVVALFLVCLGLIASDQPIPDYFKQNILTVKSTLTGADVSFDLSKSNLPDDAKTVSAEVYNSLVLKSKVMRYVLRLWKCSAAGEYSSNRGQLEIPTSANTSTVIPMSLPCNDMVLPARKMRRNSPKIVRAPLCAGNSVHQGFSSLIESAPGKVDGFKVWYNSQIQLAGSDGIMYNITAFVNVMCSKEPKPENATLQYVDQQIAGNTTDYSINFNHYSIIGCPVPPSGPGYENNVFVIIFLTFMQIAVFCCFNSCLIFCTVGGFIAVAAAVIFGYKKLAEIRAKNSMNVYSTKPVEIPNVMPLKKVETKTPEPFYE